MGFGSITHNLISHSAGNRKEFTKAASKTNQGSIVRTEQKGLSGLTPGKVFSGEVLSVTKDKVMLKLDNGQTIQAAINGDVKLVEGQKIAFMVKSNNGMQLAIKPMFEMASNGSAVLKALQDAGVPVHSKNIELVELLMAEQLPIDKDTITKFLRQMKLYPEVSAKMLVDLQKMEQPITPENIEKLKLYQNHQYQLASEIVSTAYEMTEFITQGVGIDGEVGINAFSKMIDTIFVKEGQEKKIPELLKENMSFRGISVLKSNYSEMPVLYDNLKSDAMLSGNKAGLTEVQQQALENIDYVTGKYVGQELEIEHILEGMKVLNDEAEVVLNELKDSIENPSSKAGKGDAMTRILAAFEMHETAEKSMAKAKTFLSGEGFQIGAMETQENKKGGEVPNYHNDATLKGVLDEGERNVLAQKIYKVTKDISQYFLVRAGEMSPREFVRMVNDMLPKEVVFLRENGKVAEVPKMQNKQVASEVLDNGAEILREQGKEISPQKLQNTSFLFPETETDILKETLEKTGGFPKIREDGILQQTKENEEGMLNIPKEELFRESLKNVEMSNVQKQNMSQEFQEKNNIENTKLQDANIVAKEVVTRIINEKMIEKLPELKELLQCDEFKEVLQKAVETELLIKPEEVTKEGIRAYYEKLDTKMEKLHEIVSELGEQDSNVLKNTSSIRQNVDYMNQLNQLYSYVQIPLKLSSQNANSELYVIKNKKSGRDREGTFTALLHLDMEKMGGIDVFITMERKKVALRFYLEKVSTAVFLEGKCRPFIEKLEEKGFLVTAEFEQKPEEKNVVEEFTKGEVAFSNKYSFDIRM